MVATCGDAPELELFDLEEDPGELRDLAAASRDEAERLRDLIRLSAERNRAVREQRSLPTPTLRLDEGTRRRLRALGYIR